MKRFNAPLFAAASAVVSALAAQAMAQLRVVSLNASNSTITSPFTPGPRTPWMTTILSSIGSTISDDPSDNVLPSTGITRPIDVLCLQEVNSATTTSQPYANLLNSIYPGANYQIGTLNGATTGAGTQGIVYNANALQLVNETLVGISSGTSQPRQAIRHQLRPIGYDSSADIYIYNSHYKSSMGDEGRRNDEAINIRADADALGAGKNIIYLGDFNVYTHTEPMYVTLKAAGNGQAIDPINKPGAWNNSGTFTNIHSQSPFSSAQASALGTNYTGASGGMDDRFDQQMITANMNDGDGVAYIPNSYQSFGNNGTHVLNSSIYSGTNMNTVTQYLSAVLDHLPVVADYQLPAKLGASLSAAPSQVIVDAATTATLTVNNAAPVSFIIGAAARAVPPTTPWAGATTTPSRSPPRRPAPNRERSAPAARSSRSAPTISRRTSIIRCSITPSPACTPLRRRPPSPATLVMSPSAALREAMPWPFTTASPPPASPPASMSIRLAAAATPRKSRPPPPRSAIYLPAPAAPSACSFPTPPPSPTIPPATL